MLKIQKVVAVVMMDAAEVVNIMIEIFDIKKIEPTKYLFFTGKGGVGKTYTACAIAVALADQGKKIMLVSTNPASNLQDVFNTDLDNKGVAIKEVPNLTVANFEPEVAAGEYRESVVAPNRGKLPEAVIENMTEQLSGSCTVEIASFNEFTHFITDEKISESYDHIIFDTAPTGHTLRMLQLPSAWTDFFNANKTGASCLGQLSGLGEKKEVYKRAVEVLADSKQTTLMLITRPEESPMLEAAIGLTSSSANFLILILKFSCCSVVLKVINTPSFNLYNYNEIFMIVV
jgi:arsenite-transporting ATPase